MDKEVPRRECGVLTLKGSCDQNIKGIFKPEHFILGGHDGLKGPVSERCHFVLKEDPA